MELLDLCDDILSLVLDELYKVRSRNVIHQFNDEWYKKRPWFKVLLSGRRDIHQGRAFLSKSYDLKKIEMIRFHQKYYVANILLYPVVIHRFDPVFEPIQFGLKAYFKQSSIQTKINELGRRNNWKDLKDQNDRTIIRYLMNKEETRKYY